MIALRENEYANNGNEQSGIIFKLKNIVSRCRFCFRPRRKEIREFYGMKSQNKTAKQRFHRNDDKVDNEMNMYINLRNSWSSNTSHAPNKVQLTTSAVVQSLRICQSFKRDKFSLSSPKIQIRLAKKCWNNPFSQRSDIFIRFMDFERANSAAISDFPVLCNMPPTIWSPHPTPLRFVNTHKRCLLAGKINRRKFYWIMSD